MTKLDPERRAAACELIAMMVMLSEATTPHAKELAMIVLERLNQVLNNGAPLYEVEDMNLWAQLARQNCPPEQATQ